MISRSRMNTSFCALPFLRAFSTSWRTSSGIAAPEDKLVSGWEISRWNGLTKLWKASTVRFTWSSDREMSHGLRSLCCLSASLPVQPYSTLPQQTIPWHAQSKCDVDSLHNYWWYRWCIPEPDLDLSHFITVFSSIVLSVWQRLPGACDLATLIAHHVVVFLNQGAFSQCVLESGRNMWEIERNSADLRRKYVWHGAYGRRVAVVVIRFDCVVQWQDKPDAIHVFEPEAPSFSQFSISHCFSELLIFGCMTSHIGWGQNFCERSLFRAQFLERRGESGSWVSMCLS